MPEQTTMDRRRLLRAAAAISAGVLVGPTAVRLIAGAPESTAWAAPAESAGAFVDTYRTNVLANLTPETNAAVRILSGMSPVWRTGSAWNTGAPLDRQVLRAGMRYVAKVTRSRTSDEARQAFLADRQHQSYSVIAGLGPLAELYKAGAMAVTGITTAPDGMPPTTIADSIPAGAPAGSALGAGSTSSALGAVVQLVNTVRGNFASSNPSKYAYRYPRPWRMTEDSEVIDTGRLDALGFPVYESDVVVAPQLRRQRSMTPADDSGYVSGHTNALYLAALALAYAIPERFQELVTRAFELSDTRIVAGMHSPIDVVGGRILATALAAATLCDPANAELKATARRQAAGYFQAQTGVDADTLVTFAHSADLDTDPYADRETNERMVTPRLTYTLPRRDSSTPMTVPKGAEALLETRLPYLDDAQRRDVLRTTALPAGYPVLDGPELWGRLNLFAAADGYGAFERDVHVDMDAADGGFSAADTWRNAIDGAGGLVKLGTGRLTLTGANRFRGNIVVQAGTLVAGSREALGAGDVAVRGGALRLDPIVESLRVRGDYEQPAGALEVVVRRSGGIALTVERSATLGSDSVLEIELDPGYLRSTGGRVGSVTFQMIRARTLRGRFGAITVRAGGYRAVPSYTSTGLSVRLLAA